MDKLKSILESIPLTTLPLSPLGKVESIPSTMTVGEAVEFLHSRNILSAPVCDASLPESASWKDRYVSMMDMIRVCMIVLDAFENDSQIPEEDEEEKSASLPFTISPLPSAFVHQKLSDIKDGDAGFFPFLPLDIKASFFDAAMLLGTYKIKRLPLVDETANDIVNIVTQSSLLKALTQNLGLYSAVTDQSLQALGMAEAKPVQSVRADQQARVAFELIRKHGVSAVPILGFDDELIGNISARHIYYAVTARNKLRVLEMPCVQFIRQTEDVQSSWDIKNSAITCKAADTLGSVMQRMDAAGIHRIYLCDEKSHVIRVISLCDILERFVQIQQGQEQEAPCKVL